MKNVYMDLAGGFYMDAFIKEENNVVEVYGFGSCGLNVWQINRDKLNDILEGMKDQAEKEFGLDVKDIHDLPWILLEYCYEKFEGYYDYHTSYGEYGDEYDDEFDFYNLTNKQKLEIINNYNN